MPIIVFVDLSAPLFNSKDRIKMRVIAGTFRSRPIAAPRGDNTRPTSDRLRETLFNVLAPHIEGAHFLDLYAGTGAVGIEAISRGASHITFVESAKPALTTLRANLASLKITTGYTIDPRSVTTALEHLAKPSSIEAKFDIVFLDPPYDAEDEYTRTLTTLGRSTLLAPNAIVIAEHRRKHILADTYATLHRTRTLKQGDATLSFFAT